MDQRVRDLEAAEYLDRPGEPLVHRVFTSLPLYTNTAADIWSAPLGRLTPIDLGGRKLRLNSYKLFIRSPADAGIVTGHYTLAIYEAAPFRVKDSVDEMEMSVRLLRNTVAKGSVVSDAVFDVNHTQVHVLSTGQPLIPAKQYYLYVSAEDGAQVLTPSRIFTTFYTKLGSILSTTEPPSMLILENQVSAAQAAPVVELRSKYGAAIFGDPGE